jgi:hypothetical protein
VAAKAALLLRSRPIVVPARSASRFWATPGTRRAGASQGAPSRSEVSPKPTAASFNSSVAAPVLPSRAAAAPRRVLSTAVSTVFTCPISTPPVAISPASITTPVPITANRVRRRPTRPMRW